MDDTKDKDKLIKKLKQEIRDKDRQIMQLKREYRELYASWLRNTDPRF